MYIAILQGCTAVYAPLSAFLKYTKLMNIIHYLRIILRCGTDFLPCGADISASNRAKPRFGAEPNRGFYGFCGCQAAFAEKRFWGGMLFFIRGLSGRNQIPELTNDAAEDYQG